MSTLPTLEVQVRFADGPQVNWQVVRLRLDEGVNRLQQLLQCNLGSVVDLSPAGVRILCPKPLKGKATVEILGEGAAAESALGRLTLGILTDERLSGFDDQ